MNKTTASVTESGILYPVKCNITVKVFAEYMGNNHQLYLCKVRNGFVKKKGDTSRLGISKNLGQVNKADKREVKSLYLIGGEKKLILQILISVRNVFSM